MAQAQDPRIASARAGSGSLRRARNGPAIDHRLHAGVAMQMKRGQTMPKGWLFYSLAAVVCWGLWGFLGKLAGRTLGTSQLLLLSYAGIAAVYILVVAVSGNPASADWRSANGVYAIVSGLLCGLGFLFFYLALNTGEVSRVVVLTSVYPLVTVPLAVLLLHESWSMQYSVGTLFALLGFILLSR
jgi:transporter family protein